MMKGKFNEKCSPSNKYYNFKVFNGNYSGSKIFEFIKNYSTYPLSFNQTANFLNERSELYKNLETLKSFHINQVSNYDRLREFIDNRIELDILRQIANNPKKTDNEHNISNQELDNEDEEQLEEVPAISYQEDESASRKSDL